MSNASPYIIGTLRVIAPLIILAGGAGALYWFGQKSEVEEKAVSEQAVLKVEVAAVSKREDPFIIEIDGATTPFREITYSAEVAGKIEKTSHDFRAGHFVTADTFLLQIDKTNSQLEVDRLNAQVAQADANIEEIKVEVKNIDDLIAIAKQDLDLQKRNFARIETLFRRGTISEGEYDDNRKTVLASQNSLQTLENQKRMAVQKITTLEAAKKLAAAQLERAAVDLKRTTIKAPITGTLISHEVEEGDYVKQGDPLFRVNDTTRVEVMCNLELKDLYWIWLQSGRYRSDSTATLEQQFEIPETPVTVAFQFQGTEFLWEGRFSRYAGTGMDRQTRTFPCRVIVDEPTKSKMNGFVLSQAIVTPPTLLTGMYVDIRIPVKTKLELLELPQTAVRPGDKVYVVREGKLKVVPVSVARTLEETVLIRRSDSELLPSDLAITSPLPTVTDGMPVKIIDASSDDAQPDQQKTNPSKTLATRESADNSTPTSMPANRSKKTNLAKSRTSEPARSAR